MSQITPKAARRWWIMLPLLLLGGGLFAVGYWQGEQHEKQELALKVAPPQETVNSMARLSPSPSQPMPPQAISPLPANASPEMKQFMDNREKLMAAMSQLRQQNPHATPQELQAEFHQQNGDLLKTQQQLSQKIAWENAADPQRTPPPLQIPPNASPQLKTYLTTRDQIVRDQLAFMREHLKDDPASRQAAMQQWRQENESRFTQMRQEAQALAQSTPAK